MGGAIRNRGRPRLNLNCTRYGLSTQRNNVRVLTSGVVRHVASRHRSSYTNLPMLRFLHLFKDRYILG